MNDLFLADMDGLLTVQTALIVGIVYGAVISLLGGVLLILKIWRLVKPKEPVSKDEVKRLDGRIDAVEIDVANAVKSIETLEGKISTQLTDNRNHNEHRFGEVSAKVDGVNQSLQGLSADLNRGLGRLEGRTEALAKANA